MDNTIAPASHLHVRPWLVCAVTLTLIAALALWFFVSPSQHMAPAADVVSPKIPLSGSLVVTSVSKKDGASAVYEMSLGDGQLTKIKDGYFFAPTQAADGKVAVVTEDIDGVFNLVIAQDLEGSDVTVVVPPEPAAYASRSAWSPDARYLLYVAKDSLEETSATSSLENSYIVLRDSETGEQTVLGNGASPAFMSDGSIIFVGDYGIYRMTHEGLTVSLPVAMVGLPTPEAQGTAHMSLAVSPNGSLLALADPESGQLRIYELDATGAAKNERTINVVANTPVFSADSSTLAYVTFVRDGGAVTQKKIAAHTMTTFEGVIVADMDDAEDYMFSIGAWR